MKKILYFLFLHIKKQLMMYLLPLAFVYVILIQYQRQVLAAADIDAMIRVYDISQKYICLFFAWYQYLSWRYVLFVQQREVVRFESFKKESWFILNFLFACLLLGGYFIWLSKVSDSKFNVLMLSMQCLLSSAETALLFNATGSPLSGLVIYLIYIFLCIARYIPDGWSIIRLGVMPSDYGLLWVLFRILSGAVLACCIKIKSRFIGIKI